MNRTANERNDNLTACYEDAMTQALEATETELDADFVFAAARALTEDDAPANELLQQKKQQTLQLLQTREKRASRRTMALAASFAVLVLAAVAAMLFSAGGRLPVGEPGTIDAAKTELTVPELLENLNANEFNDVKLSDLFLEGDWSVTVPNYYREDGKRCASFAVSKGELLYCVSIKYSYAQETDYTKLNIGNVTKIEKETTIYIFDEGGDASSMRYNLDNLSYDISANVSQDAMLQAANAM